MTAPTKKPPRRIFYYAGPGDVVGTFRHWLAGIDDPNEVSITYSSQFFDQVRAFGLEATVISSHCDAKVHEAEGIRVEHRPFPKHGRGALAYYSASIRYYRRLLREADRFDADLAVVSTGCPWFLANALPRRGIDVVPSLHCALWPVGHPPTAPHRRWLLGQSRKLWRNAAAILCVSPECERQVRSLVPGLTTPIHQARVQYRTDYLDATEAPADAPPFRLFFAGRLEVDKGVFDLLEVAAELHREHPGRFVWEVAGSGGARDELAAAVARHGLGDVFRLVGRLDRFAMRDHYGRAHAVVVPTTRSFPEGLNRVCVESTLAGRPVVTSNLSNATEILGDALVEVRPGDRDGYRDAILRLANEPARYDAHRHACGDAAAQFYDRERAWGAGVRRILLDAGCGTQGVVATGGNAQRVP